MAAVEVPRPGTWELPGGLGAAAQARRLVRCWLAAWATQDGEAVGNLVLAVSELAANAAEHGAPPVVLTLTAEQRAGQIVVTAAVHDAGARLPSVFAGDALDERHRGLVIVEAVTGKWGVREAADGGKDVWCEVAVPGTGPRDPAAQVHGHSFPERTMASALRLVPAQVGSRGDVQPDVASARGRHGTAGDGAR